MAMESRWLESGPAHTAAPASAHDDAAKIAASMAGVAEREAKAADKPLTYPGLTALDVVFLGVNRHHRRATACDLVNPIRLRRIGENDSLLRIARASDRRVPVSVLLEIVVAGRDGTRNETAGSEAGKGVKLLSNLPRACDNSGLMATEPIFASVGTPTGSIDVRLRYTSTGIRQPGHTDSDRADGTEARRAGSQ